MGAVLFHSGLDVVLSAEECLDDDIVDTGPEKVHVDTNLLQMLAEGAQGPLVAEIILLSVLILNKTVILLIDGVVGQMHILVLLVNLLCVRLRCKASETLLEDVDSERLVARHDHIDSQVKLVAIDQERIGDVF